ncbi:MAG: hemolysin family protein [Verrucomicrobiae bacterium]|nr:hemolysin family protein [Verrucomicrobiae bacterium]
MDLFSLTLILAFLLTILSGAFFSLMESAFFSLKPLQIRHLREKNPRFGAPIAELLDRPQRLLSIVVLGNTFSHFGACLLGLWVFHDLSYGFPVWLEVLALFFILLIFVEVIPKTLASLNPLQTSFRIVRVTRVLMICLRPVRRTMESTTRLIIDHLTPSWLKPHEKFSESEFKQAIAVGREEGLLKETESEMIRGIVGLGDQKVKDLMTPSVDLVSVSDDWSRGKIERVLREGRHRAVPVYDQTPDTIIGILNTRLFLGDPARDLSEAMEPPLLVPETMKALALLALFQKQGRRIAVVVDEFGTFSGIVTDGDIREEIFGQMEGDFDRQEWLIEGIGPGRYLIDGAATLDEIHEATGVRLVEEGVSTMGGLVQMKLENAARVGSKIGLEEGTTVTVLKMTRHRVLQVMLEKGGEG